MSQILSKFFNRSKYKADQPSTGRSVTTISGGTYVSPDTCMKASAFNRGVTYISTQIAKLPWDVKNKDLEIQRDHRVSKLIKLKPNDELNAYHFRILNIINAIQYGNQISEIERDLAGRPVALHPIKPGHWDLTRDREGKLWYRILGGNPNMTGGDVLLDPKDVFHIKNHHLTSDGLLGQGVVGYASETLGIALGSDMFANGLYANGGLPSGVLTVPGALSDEAFARLKEDWKKNHSGRRAGGTAILEEGVDYKSISMDPQVMQFLETRKFNVLEIARFLGLPPTKLFDGDSATYNNIEHANLEVATDTLDAWARNFEMEADIKLLNVGFGGMSTAMDLYAIFRGDMKTRGEYFTKRMQTGSITPNQIRIKEGDAPYVGGDEYYIATNNFTPASRVNDVIDAQISSKKESGNEEESEVDKAIANYLNRRANKN